MRVPGTIFPIRPCRTPESRDNLPSRLYRRQLQPMNEKAFQDFYPDDVSHCYGCGRLNPDGLHIQTYWDGEETVSRFLPKPHYTAIPGYVYGGLIASLIDCHATGTAAAAAYKAENRAMGTLPAFRFVTASLHVDYLKPTPMGVLLEIRGRIQEIKGRKVRVFVTLAAEKQICAQGEVLAISLPESMKPKSS